MLLIYLFTHAITVLPRVVALLENVITRRFLCFQITLEIVESNMHVVMSLEAPYFGL